MTQDRNILYVYALCLRSSHTIKIDVAKNCLHHSFIEPLKCLQTDTDRSNRMHD